MVVQGRSTIDEAFERVEQEYQRKIAALAALPKTRPATVLAEELRAAQQNRLWRRSKDCTEATEPPSRAFCDSYFRLRAEQAAAEEAVRLEGRIVALQAELASLKAQGAGQARDAQVAVLSSLFSLPEDRLRLVLIVAVALVVELGSSLGLYLAAGPQKGASIDSDADVSQPEEPCPVGDIEEFILESLVPSNANAMSAQELRKAYDDWCKRQNLRPMDHSFFERQFTALAAQIGLPFRKDRYEGIGPRLAMRHDV
jgi:hypothetical protein